MYRQSPTCRNHRSKGSKYKHILQISLLLAVCFWLIYQVKHSYDKRKEFDESDMKTSIRGQARNDFVTLGRKDPRPVLEEETAITAQEKLDEVPEDEDPILEVEEIKNEDDGSEIQDKTDSEIDGEEDFVDDENEAEEKDDEEGVRLERTNHDANDRETREENYKADDASSAVTQTATTENEKSEDRKALQMEGSEMAKNGSLANVTTGETNGSTENGSFRNNTETRGLDEVAREIHDLSFQNVTERELELNHGQANGSTLDLGNDRSDTNSTGLFETRGAESNSSSTNGTEPSELEKPRSETSFEVGNRTAEENNWAHVEKLDITNGTDEVLASEITENPEDVEHDPIDLSDSSDSLEDKDV